MRRVNWWDFVVDKLPATTPRFVKVFESVGKVGTNVCSGSTRRDLTRCRSRDCGRQADYSVLMYNASNPPNNSTLSSPMYFERRTPLARAVATRVHAAARNYPRYTFVEKYGAFARESQHKMS